MTRAKAVFAWLRDAAGAVLWPILRDEASRPSLDPVLEIRAMKWANLQLLLAEAFRVQGFHVTAVGGESDDMVLVKDDGTYLVDCRHWRATEVGANAAGRLYGAMGRIDAKAGFVITTGNFTADAREFARGLSVELIGGRELVRMLELAKETISGALPIRPLA